MRNMRQDIACPTGFPVSDGVQKPVSHVEEDVVEEEEAPEEEPED
jgi:hypothetical protein